MPSCVCYRRRDAHRHAIVLGLDLLDRRRDRIRRQLLERHVVAADPGRLRRSIRRTAAAGLKTVRHVCVSRRRTRSPPRDHVRDTSAAAPQRSSLTTRRNVSSTAPSMHGGRLVERQRERCDRRPEERRTAGTAGRSGGTGVSEQPVITPTENQATQNTNGRTLADHRSSSLAPRLGADGGTHDQCSTASAYRTASNGSHRLARILQTCVRCSLSSRGSRRRTRVRFHGGLHESAAAAPDSVGTNLSPRHLPRPESTGDGAGAQNPDRAGRSHGAGRRSRRPLPSLPPFDEWLDGVRIEAIKRGISAGRCRARSTGIDPCRRSSSAIGRRPSSR